MKKIILLFGKDGQLGFMLSHKLSCFSKLYAVGRNDCNLSNKFEIKQIIKNIKPDIIINAAAYTSVENAETNEKEAFLINADAVREMSIIAKKIDSFLIHFSTDYVFDGKKADSYNEKNVPNPINIYGKSKLAGENYITEILENFLIIRTSWVFGNYRNNFLKSILNALILEKSIKVVNDQFGAPTSTNLLSDLISHIILNYYFQDRHNFPYGLYNLSPEGRTSWFDFAKFIQAEKIKIDHNFKKNKAIILPIKSNESDYIAKRPLNGKLSANLFKKTFKINLPNWKRDVRFVLRQI